VITNLPIGGGNEDAYVLLFYDFSYVPPAGKTYLDAPLVDNTDPRWATGYCLLVVNLTDANVYASVYKPDGVTPLFTHIRIPSGNPVTTGQARSRTAAQLNAAGYFVRGDVGPIMME
jgi:hypothetical protein